jgi:penicillin-binding protein 1A
MASAYTMFPNSGTRVELRTYSKVYSYDGSILLDNSVPYEVNAISDVSAYWMTDMLVEAVVAGTGGSANLGSSMPTAGKTGSSSDYRDRWFVGFTPYYLAAVWTGFDIPVRMDTSGNPSAQIFKMLMEPIHENLETRSFSTPSDVTLRPVISEWDIMPYAVIGIDIYGNVIYEEFIDSNIGAEVTEYAPDIPGWEVIGQSLGSILISADPDRNIIRFIYTPAPEEPEPDPDPDPDPDPTPSPDPPPNPTPDPPLDPPSDPTPDPITDP